MSTKNKSPALLTFWSLGLVTRLFTCITCPAGQVITWPDGETGDLHLVCHLDRDYHLGTWSLSIFVQLIQFICTKSYIIVVNEVLSILTHNVGDDNGLPIKMYPSHYYSVAAPKLLFQQGLTLKISPFLIKYTTEIKLSTFTFGK
jgi:hypothetical protein